MAADLFALPEGWYYERIPIEGVKIGALFSRQRRGTSGTLVLLHGFTGSALSWLPFLEEMSVSGMAVIALDLLGHGLSDAPANPERYGMEHCQRDIVMALRRLGVDENKAVLLGYSLGGRIALSCAFSGYFRALILESASPGLATIEEREARRSSDEMLAQRIEREGVEAFVDYWEQIPLFASQQTLPEETRKRQRAQRLNNRVEGLANSLRGVGTGAQPALYERLPELQLPTLLLTGALDRKFCALGEAMAAKITAAHLEIIPNAGHTVHLEQPEQFVRLAREFCLAIV